STGPAMYWSNRLTFPPSGDGNRNANTASPENSAAPQRITEWCFGTNMNTPAQIARSQLNAHGSYGSDPGLWNNRVIAAIGASAAAVDTSAVRRPGRGAVAHPAAPTPGQTPATGPSRRHH